MVALDPVFLRANLTPQENAGFRANSAIFISFFPLFIMDTIQGRDWKVRLDDNTGFPCKYLSYGKLCRCFHRLREVRKGLDRVFSPPAQSQAISISFHKLAFVFFLKNQNSLLEAFN